MTDTIPGTMPPDAAWRAREAAIREAAATRDADIEASHARLRADIPRYFLSDDVIAAHRARVNAALETYRAAFDDAWRAWEASRSAAA